MTTTQAPMDSHSADDGAHSEEGHKHHICSTATFLAVFVALLIFTAVTVGIAQFDFGSGNMLIAMAVASVKASLVMAIFMHLRWDTPINNIFFISSFLFLGLFFLFTFADLTARADLEPINNRRAPLEPGQIYRGDPSGEAYFENLQKWKDGGADSHDH